MLTNANVAKACMRKKEKTLAELVSGNPQTLCTQSLEAQVSEIRGSRNWLQTIIHRTQSRWHQTESNEHELQTICTVATRADSQDSSSGHSEIPRFESTSEHLYPVEFGEHVPECKSRPRLMFMLMAHVAMLGYLLLVWRQLLDHMSESFAWHPILMSVALVMSTEGVVVMQHAPWPVPYQHRKSRKFHYITHSFAGLLLLAGIVKCTLHGDAQQQGASAAHRVMGMAGGMAFVGQFLFGVCLVTRGRKHKKLWYKYHRATGYGVLVILWAAAWLGVHSKWSQSKRAPSEWLWLLCFALLIVSVLAPVDLAKFGFRHRP
ncbi:hypothetical protein EV183_004858 [Coemansia sp. RSA 2336]|nr:hypothetical protein EV183_004858 [Coemansia sp. RSA 2336]